MDDNWSGLSEIVGGLVISQKLSASAVNPSKLIPPYNDLVERMSKAKSMGDEEIVALIGISAYHAAIAAADSVKKTTNPIHWIDLLDKSFARVDASMRLETAIRRLKAGENVDLLPIQNVLNDLRDGLPDRLVRMDTIKPSKSPLRPCGWKVIDENIGGLPDAGITVIAGPPGTGKTSLAGKLLASFVRTYKSPAGLFSLEMLNMHIVHRLLQLENLTKKEQSLIYLCDHVDSPMDLVEITAKHPELRLIIIDFAELVISGEISESQMSSMYRSLLEFAKTNKVMIVILSQLNRSYDGTIPRITMLRYSGAAEQLAGLVLLLHNPEAVFISGGDSDLLPGVHGEAYIIVGKSRWGTNHRTIGAMRVEFNPELGWGNTMTKWVPFGSPPSPKAERPQLRVGRNNGHENQPSRKNGASKRNAVKIRP